MSMPKFLDNRILEKQTIESEDIVLTQERLNYLGPELRLIRCRLCIKAMAWYVLIPGAEFVDCQIEAGRKLINFQQWCSADIWGCIFKGHYYGNDFGNRPEYFGSSVYRGSIRDCDFSNAILDACRFMHTDMSTIKLPNWPCFTILKPRQQAERIETFNWPGRLRVWAKTTADELELASAVVDYAPSMAKKYGCAEVELHDALERFGGVIM